jgi:hypothetical protein
MTTRLDEFDTVIRRRGSKTVALIPRLGLYAQGADVQSALQALEHKKEAFRQDLEAGVVDLEALDQPSTIARPSRGAEAGSILSFSIKTAILLAFLAVAGILAAEFVSAKVETVVDKVRTTVAGVQAPRIGGREFWTKLESNLERAADPASDLSEEKRQKLLSQIRVLVDRWRPFVSELAAVWTPVPKADSKP